MVEKPKALHAHTFSIYLVWVLARLVDLFVSFATAIPQRIVAMTYQAWTIGTGAVTPMQQLEQQAYEARQAEEARSRKRMEEDERKRRQAMLDAMSRR